MDTREDHEKIKEKPDKQSKCRLVNVDRVDGNHIYYNWMTEDYIDSVEVSLFSLPLRVTVLIQRLEW